MTFEQKIDRMWDLHEVENLMGRYAYLHTAHRHMETVKLFDLDRDDVWVECGGMGIYKKPEGIKRFFYDWHLSLEGSPKGALNIHTLTSPVIEVAEDGKTAKAVWISPGIETRRIQPDADLEAIWIWGKYAVDFIKDKNGQWKFWHFTITNDFMCDYHHSWVEMEDRFGTQVINDGVPENDEQNTFVDGYTKDMVKELIPEIPEPYRSFE